MEFYSSNGRPRQQLLSLAILRAVLDHGSDSLPWQIVAAFRFGSSDLPKVRVLALYQRYASSLEKLSSFFIAVSL